MPRIAACPNLVVTNGTAASNAVPAKANYSDAETLTIFAPSTLDAGTNTLEVEPTETGTSFVTLQSGGADINIAAGKAVVLTEIAWKQIRVKCGNNQTADRTFQMVKQWAMKGS